MATINDKKMIDKMIAANGALYDDEPPVVKIVEYTNAWGNIAWGLVFDSEHPSRHDRYEVETKYIRDPKVIFVRKNP
jgi:hypothetical protein